MRANGCKSIEVEWNHQKYHANHGTFGKGKAHVNNSNEGNELSFVHIKYLTFCSHIDHHCMISHFYEMRASRLVCAREIQTLRLSIHTTMCQMAQCLSQSWEIHFARCFFGVMWVTLATIARVIYANTFPGTHWIVWCANTNGHRTASGIEFNENATHILTFNFMDFCFPWNFM